MIKAKQNQLIAWTIFNLFIYGAFLFFYVVWDFFCKGPKYQIAKRHSEYIKKLIDKI